MKVRIVLWVVVMGLALSSAGLAQGERPPELQAAIASYETSKYDKAIETLTTLLARSDLQEETRIEALQYLAFSYTALNDDDNARRTFAEIVKLRPDFHPPENWTSKALSIFQKSVTISVEAAQGWAVVVGISDYEDADIRDLMFADQDAQDFYNFLVDPMRGRFDPSHVMLLVNEEATYKAMKDVLGRWLPERAGPDDLVIIFFSGHGQSLPGRREGEATNSFLIPYDCDPERMYTTGISITGELNQWLASVTYKRMVLLMDCCYSGAVKSAQFISKAPPSKDFLTLLTEAKGRKLLASCDVQQLSQECPELGHGVFTHFLLEGLKGAADDDGDEFVDVGEAYKYVSKEVERYVRENMAGAKQTPLEMGEAVGILTLASVPLFPQGATIQVNCAPWADVFLDGKPVGQTPLVIKNVSPGSHVLRLAHEGLESEERIEVKEGEVLPVARTLEAAG